MKNMHLVQVWMFLLATTGCTYYHKPLKLPEIDRRACSADAVLLKDTITIEAENGTSFFLKAGDSVYLCGPPVIGWQPIMFPRSAEPANCTYRNANDLCLLGWVNDNIKITVLG